MRPAVYRATRFVAAATIALVPALAAAQNTSSSAQPNPAAEHLAAARAALNKVLNSPAPNADAVKKLAEIKSEYIALEKAASTASPDWATHYHTIDRVSAELTGPSPSSAVSGAVGTSGTTGVTLNADMAANLQTFRKELSAFADSMGKVAPAAGATAATSASSAATPAAAASSSPAPAAAPAATAAPTTAATASTPTPTASAPATPTATAAATAEPSATAASSPAAATPSSAATPDASVLAKLDAVTTMIDAALKANSPDKTTTGAVSMDRAMLENMKAQLEQAKAALRKQ